MAMSKVKFQDGRYLFPAIQITGPAEWRTGRWVIEDIRQAEAMWTSMLHCFLDAIVEKTCRNSSNICQCAYIYIYTHLIFILCIYIYMCVCMYALHIHVYIYKYVCIYTFIDETYGVVPCFSCKQVSLRANSGLLPSPFCFKHLFYGAKYLQIPPPNPMVFGGCFFFRSPESPWISHKIISKSYIS